MNTPGGILLLVAFPALWDLGQNVVEKVGFCPDFDRSSCLYVRPAPPECSDDSQCPGTMRCCCLGCTMRCAGTVKAGTIPNELIDSILPAEGQCENDYNCTGKQKCCPQCGNKCMDPEENQGFCPIDPEMEKQCGYRPPPLCRNDTECLQNEKCCLFGCRVQCVKALPEKPGMCPALLAKGRTFDEPECQTDRDCQRNKKCCQKCGNKCLDAEPDHAGVCPFHIPEGKLCPSVPSCSSDWECEVDEKCCNGPCNSACVKSLTEKVGVCPNVAVHEEAEDSCDKCKSDKDCPGNDKCCPGAKGLECLSPSNYSELVSYYWNVTSKQ